MNYYLKLSKEGIYPTDGDDRGKYEIPEALYDLIQLDIQHGLVIGVVKRV